VRDAVVKNLAMQRSRPNFGNAGAAVAMVSRAKQQLVNRDSDAKQFELSDFGLDPGSGNHRNPLAGLYKISHIEQEFERLKAVLTQCDRDGKDKTTYLTNYVFVGSPGTGKTTVAKVMAQKLHDLGILSKPTVKVVSGNDLCGSYVGQTKDVVNDAMGDAQGGVLFIDEA
jgi:DNA replication protein DnaC